MPNKIIIKNRQADATAPLPAALERGELAVNLTDGKLYTKNASDAIIQLNAGDVTSIIAGSGVDVDTATGDVTVSHTDTSTVGDVALTGDNFVQGITFDTFGHVQTVTSGLVSVTGALDPVLDEFTANGSATTFSRAASTVSENNTFVYLDGVYQEKVEYSISGVDVVFNTAPANGVSVEVISLQANTTISFDIAGDTGTSAISGGDTFTITGPDADIVTTVVGDSVEIRVGTIDAGTF